MRQRQAIQTPTISLSLHIRSPLGCQNTGLRFRVSHQDLAPRFTVRFLANESTMKCTHVMIGSAMISIYSARSMPNNLICSSVRNSSHAAVTRITELIPSAAALPYHGLPVLFMTRIDTKVDRRNVQAIIA
jgi:hypothetical protein